MAEHAIDFRSFCMGSETETETTRQYDAKFNTTSSITKVNSLCMVKKEGER